MPSPLGRIARESCYSRCRRCYDTPCRDKYPSPCLRTGLKFPSVNVPVSLVTRQQSILSSKGLMRRWCDLILYEQDEQGELLPSLPSVLRHVRLWTDYFLRWSPAPSFLPLPASIRGVSLATRYVEVPVDCILLFIFIFSITISSAVNS